MAPARGRCPTGRRLPNGTPGWSGDALLLSARHEGAGDGAEPRTRGSGVNLWVWVWVRVRVRVRRAGCGSRCGLREPVRVWFRLWLRLDRRLRASGCRERLEVRESDTDPLMPAAYSLTDQGGTRAQHGRGLILVNAPEDTWHTSRNGRGETVWLEMGLPRSAPHPAE
ncbi:hypothetical protein ACU639_01620 [Streptomyces cynarae]|uniref:hypothetical protein n=1 Tax=Streptomyces cynarae TaxID=2981134 RepID=UPI00406BFEC7